MRKTFGPFKLKDKAGRLGKIITNPLGKYLVLTEIKVQKVVNKHDEVLIEIVGPDPETIDVVEHKKTEQSADSPGL